MNISHSIFGGALALAITVIAFNCPATDVPREHLSLDKGWKFYLGDDWPDALHLDKAGASSGPAAQKFGDRNWRTVNLPHDWAIETPFDKSADQSHGFRSVGPGFPKSSIGWYRRTFEVPATDSGKRLWLVFDGAFRDATVWVNGWLMARHEGGYYPFREDITDVVQFGGTNTISVRVDATKFEGWFYEGAGIYRHVWLDKTAPVAIAPDGIFVWSQFENNTPAQDVKIHVNLQVRNTLSETANIIATHEIISPDGKTIGKVEGHITVPGLSTAEGQDVMIGTRDPQLWSPESPKLYKLVTTLSADGKALDRQETEFGIRTVAFDPDKGFLLNGQPYVLKGTCNHQDMAGVGAALPDALQLFRIAKLKEFGCNAYRCSHNPPTPELLDVCDRLGMIVMDESRLLGSDSANLKKWDELIRRDRNHASVCIWSVANEEFSVQSTPQGGNAARTMQAMVKRIDPTRPVTYPAPEGDTFDGINGVIEVRGWNYQVGKQMDSYRAKHPHQPQVGSEQGSTVSTRGIYENDKQRGYVSAYDDNFPNWADTAERWWGYFADRPWLSGGFVWTGFDYRGEPTPYGWPCINSHFGILDTCGFPKDNFYYYQAWWTTNPVLHLLPHWNWPGKEGQEVRVDALSNCEEVEPFLNGQSLGKQRMARNSKLSWKVKYAPGVLSAKGYCGGKSVIETKVETTGEATAIVLNPNRATINADGTDVSVITVAAKDAQGRLVPVAQNKISFEISGAGKILGVGNGDPSCHEPDTFIPAESVRSISVNKWRWKLASVPENGALAPEYANEFDDKSWNTIKTKTDGDTGEMPLKDGQTAIYRAHVNLPQEEFANPNMQIRFAGIDDQGWVFVNNQSVGESHDWKAQPSFEVKKFLHPGDNVIAVGVRNDAGTGGLNPDVNLDVAHNVTAAPWSRSLFNGLAQILVQSSAEAGEIKLTAKADNLQPASLTIRTVNCPKQPSVP